MSHLCRVCQSTCLTLTAISLASLGASTSHAWEAPVARDTFDSKLAGTQIRNTMPELGGWGPTGWQLTAGTPTLHIVQGTYANGGSGNGLSTLR